MKTLILASLFGLALQAQAPIQLLNPPPNIGVWQAIQQYKAPSVPPSSLVLNFKVNPQSTGVCSVPLLEATVGATDSAIGIMPSNTAVAMPQANVPAPTCGASNHNEQAVALKHPTRPFVIPPYIHLGIPLITPGVSPKP